MLQRQTHIFAVPGGDVFQSSNVWNFAGGSIYFKEIQSVISIYMKVVSV